MPYLNGHATDLNDLVSQIVAWCIDSSIHGDDAWELMRSESAPRGTILKAHGWEEGEKQYIGLMPQTFAKGVTYAQWFLQQNVLAREFVHNRNGLNKPLDTPDINYFSNGISIGKYDKNVPGSKPIYYTFQSPEIFDKSCQALFFGVFKQYSEGLDWHEQAGGPTPPARPKSVKYKITDVNLEQNFTPPVYPGVGFPAIGVDYSGFIDGLAEFWLVKDRHRIIITINNGGFWEVVNVGFMEPYHKPSEYAFPACVIGGTSGVMPVYESFFYYGSSYPTIEAGYRFDYTPSNWCLSHGNVLFASTYWDGSSGWSDDKAVSQAQVMLPDGTWRSFSNWAIRKEAVWENYTGSYPPYQFVNKEPEQPLGIKNYIRPTFTNVSENTNVYYQDDSISNTYQLEPVEFVQSDLSANTINMLGSLWRMYWTSYRVAKYGKQRINGKLHLVLPNCWETRKFHIPHGLHRVMESGQLLALQTRIEKISNTMNCIIRLED
jgi:hypothetical protein